MKSHFFAPLFSQLKIVAIAAALLLAVSPVHADPARWKGEIDQLLKTEEANPPAPGGIVFIGSSSIKRWSTLKSDFPNLNVINHGFGGSQLEDSVFYIDRLVVPAKPRAVVVYAGENDLASGATPQKVAADFEEFRKKIHASLPGTRVIFISLKPSPSREKHWAKFTEANALISATCARDPLCRYVDVGPAMLDAAGKPREELFVADRLHMSAAGYAIWTKILAPHLSR
ncbi:SGNH/GDSL hydrolase family protein [Oleiharenicola lentus]|uniref:SGNH/GDSL hydrolase family protein n=1 Tax=Oleiharenicola lentus TaxID=2508720 RepID=UPI003F6701D9